MPPAFYTGWLILSLIPAIGLLLYTGKVIFRKLQPEADPKPSLVFIQVLAAVLTLLQLIYFNMHVAQPQGRYLFQALPSLAILWVFGFTVMIDSVFRQIKKKTSWQLGYPSSKSSLVIILIFFLANIYALFDVLVPAYKNLGR